MREYLEHAQSAGFARKLERAMAELRALTCPVVYVSWGKDSVACLDLAVQACGRVEAVHLASPYELPGNDEIIAWARSVADVHVVESGKSLAETVEWLRTIGLAYERRADHKAGVRRKTDRGLAWMRENARSTQVLGMRAEESRGRKTCFRVRGLTYQAHGLTVCNPIGWWSSRDVWAHIESRGLPYNRRIYDAETHGFRREELRNGGWLTLNDPTRVTWLRKHFPEQYRILVQEFPQVAMLT